MRVGADPGECASAGSALTHAAARLNRWFSESIARIRTDTRVPTGQDRCGTGTDQRELADLLVDRTRQRQQPPALTEAHGLDAGPLGGRELPDPQPASRGASAVSRSFVN